MKQHLDVGGKELDQWLELQGTRNSSENLGINFLAFPIKYP